MDKCPLSIHERYHIQNSEPQPEHRPHHLSRDHSHGQGSTVWCVIATHRRVSVAPRRSLQAVNLASSFPPHAPRLLPCVLPLTLVAPVCSLHPASRASVIFAPQPVNNSPLCRPTSSCHTTTLLIRKCLAHSFAINASSSTKRH